MKRLNLQDAFVGDANPHQEGTASEDGDEAVLLAIRGGELTVVVPADTPDDLVLADAAVIRGALRLENERVLVFEIHSGASGAFFEDEPVDLHRRRHQEAGAGLSTIGSAAYMDEPAPGAALGMRPGTAQNVMSTTVVTVGPDEPVQAIASLLDFHRISGVPVVNASRAVVGVVSQADVMGRTGQTAADIMTQPAVTVGDDMSIDEIAALMIRSRINRVPVVRADRLVGLVSRGDIVHWISGAATG